MARSNRLRVGRILLSVLLTVLALFYLYCFVCQHMGELDAADFRPGWLALSAALLISILAHLFNSWLWWYSLRRMGVDAGFAESYRSWALSRLARYIPGKVFAYVVRVGLHESRHRAGSVGVAVVEAITTMGSLILISFLGTAFYWQQLGFRPEPGLLKIGALIVLAACLATLLLWPLGQRLVRRIRSHLSVPTAATWVRLAGAQVALLLCHAAAFFLLLTGMTQVDWFWYPYVVAAYYIAALVGQLAVLVPAGLGVREASLLALLAPIAGGGVNLLYAVLMIRIVLVGSELVNAGVALLVYRITKPAN